MGEALAEESSQAETERRWSQLMVRAQAGEEAPYRELLSELAQAATAFIRQRLGGQHFVDDCVQECLLAVHQARHTYDNRRPFRAWFYAIVRHKLVDTLRRQSGDQRRDQAVQQHQLGLTQGVNPSPESDLDRGQLLQSLTPQYREALTLTKLLGFSSAEAAAQLSISERALKVRVHRAMNRLRDLLEAERL
jgi:RNA polymerase sigma-70 factor (ECF subfamily)